MLNRPLATVYKSTSYDAKSKKAFTGWHSIDVNNNNNFNHANSNNKNKRNNNNTNKHNDDNDDDNNNDGDGPIGHDNTSHTNSESDMYHPNNNIENTLDRNLNGNEYNPDRKVNLIWPYGKKGPGLIIFSPEVVLKTCVDCRKIGEQFHLAYKFQGGEKRVVKTILDGHGFKEVHPHSSEFNILWTGSNLKTYVFRTLKEFQKVNHFPRSCELTRKDRLYKNVQRMQQEKGLKAFQIAPITFVMPYEYDDFYSTFYKEKGLWIVKPVASSRGRGIYLINHPDQVPLDDNLVVSKYISNPLLIEGFKFDLRLYVAVTSFDPLVIYLYEEGLTRFATIKYDKTLRNTKNVCMHLTNYSVNKKNKKYVRCDDPDVEDYGNKWSMSAMLRYLAREGKDTFGLMMHIEELIIKTIISVESPLASAARMFIPFRGNCFEVFGFDILVDEELKPWVLEVNLSPSLDCDAVLDLKIKSHMVSDLFSLTGVYCQDPIVFSNRSRFNSRSSSLTRTQSVKSRPSSANLLTSTLGTNDSNNAQRPSTCKSRTASFSAGRSRSEQFEGLSQNESSIFKSIQDENNRRGGWVRIFPTEDTWEFFSQFLETRATSYNVMLHQKQFPKRWLHGISKKTSTSRAKILQSSYMIYKQTRNQNLLTTESGACLNDAIKRYKQYERKLGENLTNSSFEAALKKFASTTSLNMDSNKTNSNYDSDVDTNSSASKPPIGNSYSSFGMSRKKDFILDGSKKSSFQSDTPSMFEYNLETVLKCLNEGYFISRVQVRHAFALYLSKIQARLIIESEVKDESNTQQMNLVIRFMKKASVNLSQHFTPYVPSKRLPLYEQKRMLAKQLQDFLHIYKRDSENIKLETTNNDFEAQKTGKKTFNESELYTFLSKCSEIELEEIMSSYMKNSKDSSAFLGTSGKTKSTIKPTFDTQKRQQSYFEKSPSRPATRSTSNMSRSGYSSFLSDNKGNETKLSSSSDDDDSITSNLSILTSSIASVNNLQHRRQRTVPGLNPNLRINDDLVTKSTKDLNELKKLAAEKQPRPPSKRFDLKAKTDEMIKAYTKHSSNNIQIKFDSLKDTSDEVKPVQARKTKSATIFATRKLSQENHETSNTNNTNEDLFETVMRQLDETSNKNRPISAAVYVQKHAQSESVLNSKRDEFLDQDLSSRLKNLSMKQHERLYSASAKKALHSLNTENETQKQQQQQKYDLNDTETNNKSTDDQEDEDKSMNESHEKDELLIKQTKLIKKQKEMLEQSKKVLELSKSNALFSSLKDTNNTRMLSALERYSPVNVVNNNNNNAAVLTTTTNPNVYAKPPPAPLTQTLKSKS